ncbi:MAG: DNA glycosylase [Verrucomicrobiota bacterium]
METGHTSDFDLAATLHSGQSFVWHDANVEGKKAFQGIVGSAPVRLAWREDNLDIVGITEEKVGHYLALDHDLEAIRASFPGDDSHLAAALEFCPGLRILRQPKWECLASFICSSLKQVTHIRQMSLTLRQRFGERARLPDGTEVPLFPSPEALAAAGEKALRECALGYRAKALWLAADCVARGDVDLEALADLEDDDELCHALCGFHGVGEKIAHCVMLFAYERMAAFPVDTWVMRVLKEWYFPRRRKPLRARDCHEFAHKHFGPNAGYAQQFLFHYARTSGVFSGEPRKSRKGAKK